ncbi:unnamed protein product [Rangifer tarandus platyrhynchus]|uniref:Uncharacterized protein n=1 Tax=Rangifer tarandus platyrhynchus TaxID=3082113 RepID=A0AC59Z6E0_RANTA
MLQLLRGPGGPSGASLGAVPGGGCLGTGLAFPGPFTWYLVQRRPLQPGAHTRIHSLQLLSHGGYPWGHLASEASRLGPQALQRHRACLLSTKPPAPPLF